LERLGFVSVFAGIERAGSPQITLSQRERVFEGAPIDRAWVSGLHRIVVSKQVSKKFLQTWESHPRLKSSRSGGGVAPRTFSRCEVRVAAISVAFMTNAQVDGIPRAEFYRDT
jgi:hypothetical protein